MIERKKHLIFFFFSSFFISRWSSNESKSIDRIFSILGCRDTDFWIRLSPVVQDQILFLPRITESLIIYIIGCTQRWMIQRTHSSLHILSLYLPTWTTTNIRRRNDGRLMMNRRWIRAQFLTRRGKRFNNWRTIFRIDGSLRDYIFNFFQFRTNLFSRLLFSLGKKNSNERYTPNIQRTPIGWVDI